VARDGQEVPLEAWRSAKARELLLYLVVHEPRSREQIGLALWPEASEVKLRNAFHVTLHNLRRALGRREWITFEAGAYGLRRPGGGADDAAWALAVDADALLAAAAGARQAIRRQATPDDAALAAWRAALVAPRGTLGEGVPAGDWIVEHQDRLRAAHADGLVALAQLQAARGDHTEAAATYVALLARDPLREAAHRELMRAYAAAGEPARALQHYAGLVRLLRRELGTAPARETTALAESLRTVGATP
jgi:DNA-binding SARP family transcriptional activator